MCGIAVMLGIQGRLAEAVTIQRMMASLVHRGPDDAGMFISGSVGFGFRRLSILDLSSLAHQPMISEDGRYVVVFNGAIYNYIELRDELRQWGHTFRSSGDTEVLLRAYQQWGPECLARFNGMWAFVIYDSVRRVLFGSRDRFGEKPLYYYRSGDTILLASEIKAICASGLYEPALNWKIAAQFLLEQQLDHTRDTFYEGIQQLPAGTAFELDCSGQWKEWRYWSLGHVHADETADPVQAFADLFDDVIRIRMRSDVPVGVSLSGGLDSTSILAAMVRQRQGEETQRMPPLHAFIYQAEGFDETRYLNETIALTKAQPHQVQVSAKELWNRFPTVLGYHDEPVHTLTAAVGFEIYRAAQVHGIRVMQTGQGADETLAGYSSYFMDAWVSILRSAHVVEAWKSIGGYTAVHGGSASRFVAAAFLRLLTWRLHSLGLYRQLVQWKNEKRVRTNPWFSLDLGSHWRQEQLREADMSLDGMLRRSVEVASLPLYLRVEDRNSMAHAVETRLPFLDHRLVELAFSLSADMKINGPWSKVILREAMRHRIPESVRLRSDKMGFPTPSAQWVGRELHEPIRELVASRAVRERGIYNPSAILKDLDRHRAGEIDVAQRLFHVVEMEMLFDLMKESGRAKSVNDERRAEIPAVPTASSAISVH